MTRRRISGVRLPRSLVPCVLLLAAPLLAAESRAVDRETVRTLAELRAAATGPVTQRVSPITGLATFVAPESGSGLILGMSRFDPPEARARSFLNRYGPAFGITDAQELILRKAPTFDELGMEHVRLRQVHNGILVTGGELSVHLRGNGLVAVHAKTVAGLTEVSTTPRVPAREAAAAARRVVEEALGDSDFSLTAPRLELFNRGLLENRTSTTRLAWFVEARSPDLRQYIWIDAHNGSELLHFSQLSRALYREVYDAADASVLAGAPGFLPVCAESDCPTGDSDGDLAFQYAGDTWDYFWNQHGRDSYDDAGATLRSTVRYPISNAYWHSGDAGAVPPLLPQMVYGAGYPEADDVTAHEITHAVIEHTADFFYYMQSGALSESYADVFGETVDLLNGAGTDTADVRWLLGEDLPCGDPAPGACASRDMLDPTLFGDPASTLDWRFVCEDPGDDGGGVHSNSGVPNHAFALLVDGGAFNDTAVDGIGLAKAGKIYYRALAHYLLSASNFTDHVDALIQSCADLLGVAGIDSADCSAVEASIQAVKLDQPWPCEPTSPAANLLCSVGDPAATLFLDDFETNPAGSWSTATRSGENVWGWGHDFATSGTSHLRGDLLPHCDDSASNLATDSSVEMTSSVYVPSGGAYLQFAHAFGFENYSEVDPREYYDGGVLEYSIDDGLSWSDAGDLITAGKEYGGSLETDFGNPLGGRQAFVADSWGYASTQADLVDVANMWVRFRFRIGTDDSTDFCDYGWFVDDVRIFTCPDSCVAMPESGCLDCTPALSLVSGGAVESIETWVGCDSIHAGNDFGVGTAGHVTLLAPLVTFGNGFDVEHLGTLTVITQ